MGNSRGIPDSCQRPVPGGEYPCGGDGDAMTDRDLLTEYARTGSGEAFEELVLRHGGLVFGTCLRILGRREDAEDAAQAVFLVLARKARSLTGFSSIAGWIHEVAWNVARRHRTAVQRRSRREREAVAMRTGNVDPAAEAERLRPVLDGALAALPEKYRLPIALCHLEGKSVEEGAAAAG